jgi:hypothetical protein
VAQAHHVSEKLTLFSKAMLSMLRASTNRAFYHWKHQGITMANIMEVKSAAAKSACSIAIRNASFVLDRIERQRNSSKLRESLDRWFLAVHSKEMKVSPFISMFHLLMLYLLNLQCVSSFKVICASRAMQLLFTIDMRLLQRSYMRWRALGGNHRSNTQMSPIRSLLNFSPGRNVEALSPLSDSLNSKTPTGDVGELDEFDFNNSDAEPWPKHDQSSGSVTPVRYNPVLSRSIGVVSSLRRDEVGHFRRLLWAHMRSQGDSSEAWKQGRKSVLQQSQKSMSLFILRRLQSKRLWISFSHWRKVVSIEVHDSQNKRSLQATACLSTSNILKKMVNVSMLKAFRTWVGFSISLRMQQDAAEKRIDMLVFGCRVSSRLAQRLSRNKKKQALMKWRSIVLSVKYTTRQWRSSFQSLSMMVGRGRSEKVRRAFMNWVIFNKCRGFQNQHRSNVMKRALKIAYNINLHRALGQWRRAVGALIETESALRRLMLLIEHSAFAVYFRYWRKVSETMRFQDHAAEETIQIARKVVSKMVFGSLSRGFSQWKHQVNRLPFVFLFILIHVFIITSSFR